MYRFVFFLVTLSSITHAQFSYLAKSDSGDVHQILNYSLQTLIQSHLEYCNMLVNQKIFAEAHLGIGYIQDVREAGFVSFNLCPFNSKIPFVTDIRAKMFRIQELSRILGDSLSPASKTKLQLIESKLETYDRQKWLRFSLGIFFPFTVIQRDTSYGYRPGGLTAQGLEYDVLDTTYSINRGLFFLDDIGCCVNYDIGDYGTLSIGMAFSKRIFVGYSLDISTPIYSMMVPFMNNLKSWLGLPLPSTGDIFLRTP